MPPCHSVLASLEKSNTPAESRHAEAAKPALYTQQHLRNLGIQLLRLNMQRPEEDTQGIMTELMMWMVALSHVTSGFLMMTPLTETPFTPFFITMDVPAMEVRVVFLKSF